MRKELIAAVSVLALMTGTALAQSSTSPGAAGSTAGSTSGSTMQKSDQDSTVTSTGGATTGTTAGATMPAPAATTTASADKMLGKNVYGKDGEKLGEVEDIILDGADGKAKQLVISSGGFLGIGEKQVAVDFDQAKWNASEDRLELSTLTRNDVKSMAEFKYNDTMTSLNKNRKAGDAPAPAGSTTAPPRQ
ncbi:MAG TPA: PRC-barrel domain-containing protein [Azospirillum sp.]|nr:PRC-barrel domain-containing protein [Azospirillum sp.]